MDAARNAADAAVAERDWRAFKDGVADGVINVAVEEGLDHLSKIADMDKSGERDEKLPRAARTRSEGVVLVDVERRLVTDPDDYQDFFLRSDEQHMSALAEIKSYLERELARGDLAARGEVAELDVSMDQDSESVFQNVWTYAAIGLVVSALGVFTSDRSLLQMMSGYAVIFVFLQYAKAYIAVAISNQQKEAAVRTREGHKRNLVLQNRTLLMTWLGILVIAFGLIVFAIVTTIMTRVTPILKESGPSITALVLLVCVPLSVSST